MVSDIPVNKINNDAARAVRGEAFHVEEPTSQQVPLKNYSNTRYSMPRLEDDENYIIGEVNSP